MQAKCEEIRIKSVKKILQSHSHSTINRTKIPACAKIGLINHFFLPKQTKYTPKPADYAESLQAARFSSIFAA
jgi:hypothetical protein